MRARQYLAAAAIAPLLVGLAACGTTDAKDAADTQQHGVAFLDSTQPDTNVPAPDDTVTQPDGAPTTSAPDPTPVPVDDESTFTLPKGFPKVVKVSSLPSQVRNWYEMDGYKRAVQVAPGVWTPLPPGATVEDAINSLVFDGFTASKAAFERQYLDGQPTAGVTW